MFNEVAPVRSFPARAFAPSIMLHALLLLVLIHRPAPIFVAPSSVARGNGTHTYYLVYDSGLAAAHDPEPGSARLAYLRHARKVRNSEGLKKAITQTQQTERKSAEQVATAGTPYGSLDNGSSDGHDVRPAYPVVFPDPPINRAQLPPGVEGDVIVEVAIDAEGNVVAMRLLQGVGHGIDEKIMATLKNWHYNPARMDGSPIAEKHDVHFHLPS